MSRSTSTPAAYAERRLPYSGRLVCRFVCRLVVRRRRHRDLLPLGSACERDQASSSSLRSTTIDRRARVGAEHEVGERVLDVALDRAAQRQAPIVGS